MVAKNTDMQSNAEQCMRRSEHQDTQQNLEQRVYRYARVSSRDQHLDRQLDALRAFGVDEVFADKASGRDFERPAWRRLKARLSQGDVLVVGSIDRLGRSYEEVVDQWRDITRTRGAAVVVLDMPLLDTRRERDGVTGALIGDIVLQLLSYVAQVERESIHQRQAEGIAAAKARGVRFGRPAKRRPDTYPLTREAYLLGASPGARQHRAWRSPSRPSINGYGRIAYLAERIRTQPTHRSQNI